MGSLQVPTGNDNPRLQKFTEGIISGLSMAEAARRAGYSESTADQACRALMPQAREVFRRTLEHYAPLNKVTKRIAEGLDAEETKFFQKDGIVQDERNVVAWSERRESAALATRLLGFMPEKTEVSGLDGSELVVRIIAVGSEK